MAERAAPEDLISSKEGFTLCDSGLRFLHKPAQYPQYFMGNCQDLKKYDPVSVYPWHNDSASTCQATVANMGDGGGSKFVSWSSDTVLQDLSCK